MDIFSFNYESAKRAVLRILLDGSAHKMYVEAWMGVGATALLREVAEEVETRRKREFKTVIKVVLRRPFRNPVEMQRAVAEQLNHLLPSPSAVAAAFDAADEDDDFSGVEFSSRGLLSEVAKETYRAVRDRSSVLLVLCKNIADGKLIDPNELPYSIIGWSRGAVLWTSGMNISREAASASADLIVKIEPSKKTTALDLVYKEAVEIARYIDESSGGSLRTTPQVVLRCFWYCMLLFRRAAFNRSAPLLPDGGRPLEAAVKYFVCDGILQGDDAASWEIGRALAPVIGPVITDQLLQHWEKEISYPWTPRLSELRLPPKTLLIDSITQGDWVKSLPLETKSYHWISICSPQNNNPEPWDFLAKLYGSSVMSNVSSFFGHFEETLKALPDGFFDHFSNVRVLDLLGCIVSPIGHHSSFLRLCNLRMLRLERCKVITSLDPNAHSSAPEGRRELPIFFDNLWVLNLYNSDADAFLLAGKAFEHMPNLLELDLKDETSLLHLVAANELQERMHKLKVFKLSGNINAEFLQKCLSMAISLKELILTACERLEYLNFNLPATIETISLQRCASLIEVDPAVAPLPNLKTFRLGGSKLIAKLSLQGCCKLENVDLQELMGLEVLDVSCTAIKVVDVSELPQLKQLFILGCEQLRRVAGLDKGPEELDALYLDNYNSGSTWDVDRCLDSFRNQRPSELAMETNDADQRLFHAHVVVRDVRLFRSLRPAFPNLSRAKSWFHIHVKGSSPTAKKGTNIGTSTRSNATITSASCYADVLNTMADRHRRHHPSPPAMALNNHIEVDGGHDSKIVEEYGFTSIMEFANSLFIHDNTSNFTMGIEFRDLKCFRIERCPDLEFILTRWGAAHSLESIWLSQLPRLKALNGEKRIRIGQLKHIYLEFCARLEYVVFSVSELHDLETINIRYCGDLTAIFKSDDDNNEDEKGAAPQLLPKLRSIHLQELPKLRHIHERNICAPSLGEIKIMGCFNLKKLSLFGRSDACSMRAVEISCEKDWWDKLQWDGLESNHHSSLFNPKHCPYYKKRMKATYL